MPSWRTANRRRRRRKAAPIVNVGLTLETFAAQFMVDTLQPWQRQVLAAIDAARRSGQRLIIQPARRDQRPFIRDAMEALLAGEESAKGGSAQSANETGK